jgi:hypothetical protein
MSSNKRVCDIIANEHRNDEIGEFNYVQEYVHGCVCNMCDICYVRKDIKLKQLCIQINHSIAIRSKYRNAMDERLRNNVCDKEIHTYNVRDTMLTKIITDLSTAYNEILQNTHECKLKKIQINYNRLSAEIEDDKKHDRKIAHKVMELNKLFIALRK